MVCTIVIVGKGLLCTYGGVHEGPSSPLYTFLYHLQPDAPILTFLQ